MNKLTRNVHIRILKKKIKLKTKEEYWILSRTLSYYYVLSDVFPIFFFLHIAGQEEWEAHLLILSIVELHWYGRSERRSLEFFMFLHLDVL